MRLLLVILLILLSPLCHSGQVAALFSSGGDTVCYRTSSQTPKGSKKLVTTFIIAIKDGYHVKMISRMDLKEPVRKFKKRKGIWEVGFHKVPKDSIQKYDLRYLGYVRDQSKPAFEVHSEILNHKDVFDEKGNSFKECLVLKQILLNHQIVYETKVLEIIKPDNSLPVNLRIQNSPVVCEENMHYLLEFWEDSSELDPETHKVISTHSHKTILIHQK